MPNIFVSKVNKTNKRLTVGDVLRQKCHDNWPIMQIHINLKTNTLIIRDLASNST